MEGKIFLNVARDMENDILSGAMREGDAAPSTHQLAERYGINPATAARGAATLTARGIFIKKRGIGLFVAEGAREQIMNERREAFRDVLVKNMLDEARLLGISKRDLVAIIMGS